MNENMEPCWFCGSINISVESFHKEYRLSHWWIECCDCGARGSKRDSKEAAKKAWVLAKVYAERDTAVIHEEKALSGAA